MQALAVPQMPVSPVGATPEALAARAKPGQARTLDEVATGFESVFLSMLIKQMRQTLAPGTLFGGDNSDVQGGLFDLYLSQHLARAGGLGIGKMLKQYLETAKLR